MTLVYELSKTSLPFHICKSMSESCRLMPNSGFEEQNISCNIKHYGYFSSFSFLSSANIGTYWGHCPFLPHYVLGRKGNHIIDDLCGGASMIAKSASS